MTRILMLLAGLMLVAGCATNDLDEPPLPLGDFRLGHNIVVASKMQQVPGSRDATQEQWVETLTAAVNDRFGRYEGGGLYHFGISVEGFMLAPPGVPLLVTPKSALIIRLTVWDDEKAIKLNEKAQQLTILEATGKDSVIIGSGWARDADQQMAALSYQAVKEIEIWLGRQMQAYGWFTPDEAVRPADAEDEEQITELPG